MLSSTSRPATWKGSLNPLMDSSHATRGMAAANPTATAISARCSALTSVFSRKVSLTAAKMARWEVATPTPVSSRHARNRMSTTCAWKPNCGTMPKASPPAPCKNKPTTMSAVRPLSMPLNRLKKCEEQTTLSAKALNTTPFHMGPYPYSASFCGKMGMGAAMRNADVKLTPSRSATKTDSRWRYSFSSSGSSNTGSAPAPRDSRSSAVPSPPPPMPPAPPPSLPPSNSPLALGPYPRWIPLRDTSRA
mmetsp:Transcript_17161/g.42417  ORF Transcript_17161/g.42417 Transcript_17161/m.42417 type:complete len:248 (+) Transcript_17161:1215-1958(+)